MSEATHVGKESVISTGGRDWRVGRWTRDVWDTFLGWARKRLPDPLDVAERMMARLPEASHPIIVRECIALSTSYLSINSGPVQELLSSIEGTAYMLHLCLQEHQPGATEDDAWNILHSVANDIVREALDKAGGKVPPSVQGKDQAPPE